MPILEEAELRLPRAGLHALRHTYVSLLINQGEDPRYIPDQVGHSPTRLTTDLYAHMFNRVRVQAMRRLDRWASEAVALCTPSNLGPPLAGEGGGQVLQDLGLIGR